MSSRRRHAETSAQGGASQDVDMDDLEYDPHAPATETREIRTELRGQISVINEHMADVDSYKPDDMLHDLDKLNTTYGKVKRAQEATLDSKAMQGLSEIASLKARNMKHSAGGFDSEDFIAKLITFMGGRRGGGAGDDEDAEDVEIRLDWAKVGALVMKKSRRAIGLNHMLGPMSVEPKKRKEVKRAATQKKKQTVADRPDDISHEEAKKSENDTSHNVRQIARLLEQFGEEGVNYFRFVLNPYSFSQSVENIFYFSFLIKEGNAAWEFRDDEEPFVFACEPPSEAQKVAGATKQQAVLELDVATWQRAIKAFNITDPIIPTRPDVPEEEKYPSFKQRPHNSPEAEEIEVNAQSSEEERTPKRKGQGGKVKAAKKKRRAREESDEDSE